MFIAKYFQMYSVFSKKKDFTKIIPFFISKKRYSPMIDLCSISEERKKGGFSARIISDLPEFTSSVGGKSPFYCLGLTSFSFKR